MAVENLLKRRQQLDKLGDLAPGFSVAFEFGAHRDDLFYSAFPFRRSLPAIVICGAMLAVFSVPLVGVGSSLTGGTDELFSFVGMAFSLFWLLGWSVGVLLIALAFLVLLLGRETLHVTRDALILRIGIPGIGLGVSYPKPLLRHFRQAQPNAESEPENPADKESGRGSRRTTRRGTEWRGAHLQFDFAGQPVAFASQVSAAQATRLLSRLQALFPDQASPLPEQGAISALATSADNNGSKSTAGEVAAPADKPIGAIDASVIRWQSPSALALIAANLVPLAGVFVADWNVGDLMLLFWAESAIIGIYNLLKMARVAGWTILFIGPFFIGHYGGFMVGHLLFIYTLFINGLDGGTDVPLHAVFADFVSMAPALVAFVFSHGVSYVHNFLGRQEYLGRDANAQMGQPYKRIVIMHVTIIFGGFLVMALGSALPALLLLISLKLGADLYAHLREHRMSATATAQAVSAS